MKYKVGIIGCGAILPRHLEAIEASPDFNLEAVCDIQPQLVNSVADRLGVLAYTDYRDMIKNSDVNFIVVATPNSIHYEQSIYALNNGCDVLVEKPVAFTKQEVDEISRAAIKAKQKAYCVLQVRLNPTVQLMVEVLKQNMLGSIRAVNFVQRWQRPLEYFTGWRAEPTIGGGTLYEVGIHYLDILQYLFGKPTIVGSKCYEVKHRVGIEDTIYALLDFGNFGGTCEVTIAAEPQNLECSISVLGSNGYIKLGGKALNIIESARFLSHGSQTEFDKLQKGIAISTEPNSYGSYQGSCPNHPFVYNNLNKFTIDQTINVISLIDEIYEKSNIKYRK
jgi:UDP-N-acetyl-2-amino-2-deoxyglucuronate dehydrogenase